MNQKQRLLLLLFSFTIGFMMSVMSLRSSFTGPKVDPFCSPPDHLLDQWDMKEWKVYAIPRFAASENFALVDSMHHSMRDYKWSECLSYGINKDPETVTSSSSINNISSIKYTLDLTKNVTCVNGYSFEDPGSSVSFIAEFELLCHKAWLFPAGQAAGSIIQFLVIGSFVMMSGSKYFSDGVLVRKFITLKYILPIIHVICLSVHCVNTLWSNDYQLFFALESVVNGVILVACGCIICSIAGELTHLTPDQILVLITAFNTGWYSSSLLSFALIEIIKSWRNLLIIMKCIYALLLTIARDRCEDVYGRCEETVVSQSMISSSPHFPPPHSPAPTMVIPPSIGSGSTLLTPSPHHSNGQTAFSFEDPMNRQPLYKEMAQSVILCCTATFLYHVPYNMRQERSCFTSSSTFWCLTSVPITELISLLATLILHSIHRSTSSSPSSSKRDSEVTLSSAVILSIASTFMTINRVLQKREASSPDSNVKADFVEADVHLMQNLSSTLIISSMFLVTHAHLWMSKIVTSRQSLLLPMIAFTSSQLVAAAVPSVAFWVIGDQHGHSFVLMTCLAWVSPVILFLVHWVDY